MDLKLTGRVAIVTGGSMGIGYAIAKTLLEEGMQVAIAARREPLLKEAAQQLLNETGKTVLTVSVDTTKQSQVDAMAAAVLKAYGRVDVLVNCAANPSGRVRNEVQHFEDTELLQDLDTKVVGYTRCVKAVVSSMMQNKWGRIINIGGLTCRASHVLSGMRNAALCHLTKTLSDQLGPNGITVNAIHPGVIQTPHIIELFEREATKRGVTPEVIENEFAQSTPIRRVIAAEEVAHAVAFLASPLAEAITGESIAVDGGITRGIYL